MYRTSLAVVGMTSRQIALMLVMVGLVRAINAEEPDPLAKLNGAFRRIYQQARAERLAAAGPIIVSDFDEIILLHKGTRTKVESIPAAYHRLKAISHVPLAVFLVVSTNEKLTTDQAAELVGLRELTVTARRSLDRFFADDQLKRQKNILDEALTFVDRVLKAGRCSSDEAVRFARGLMKPISANMNDAAKVQIDALHDQMMKWKKELTAEEWNKLRVVILGSQMPRKDNAAAQYFAKLLGEPGEGKRIIYAEGLGDERKALNLLGTHLLDTDIGQAFFDEPLRMHRDLLGDGAKEYLKMLSWADHLALEEGLSETEKKEGFVSLFNGKDLTGWRFDDSASPPAKLPQNWKVEEGVIKVLGGGQPHLASASEYGDFELRFQWRGMRDKYNSGLFIRSGRKVGANQINLARGSEGAFIGGKISGAKAVPQLQKPAGQWNEWRVRVHGDQVSFWCNGQLAWEATGLKPEKGYLGLQAEGALMEFRNLRLRLLK